MERNDQLASTALVKVVEGLPPPRRRARREAALGGSVRLRREEAKI